MKNATIIPTKTVLEWIFLISLLFTKNQTITAFSLHNSWNPTTATLTNFHRETKILADNFQGSNTALLYERSTDVRSSFKRRSRTALRVERTSILDGFRERARYDNQFTKKLTVELFVGFLAQLFAEVSQRGDNSWNEMDLISADLVQGLIANFFAVYLSAPRKTTRSYGIGKKISGLNFWDSLPDNAFQKCKQVPLKSWSLLTTSATLSTPHPHTSHTNIPPTTHIPLCVCINRVLSIPYYNEVDLWLKLHRNYSPLVSVV